MTSVQLAAADPRGNLRAGIRQFVSRSWARMSGFAGILAGLAAATALASYDSADPSLLRATDRAAANLLGFPGSVFADLLLQAVGVAAALVPALLLTWGSRRLFGFGRGHGAILAAFLLPTAVLATPALSLLEPPAAWPLAAGLGGVTGELLQVRLQDWALRLADVESAPGLALLLSGLMALLSFLCFTIAHGGGFRHFLAPFLLPVRLALLFLSEIWHGLHPGARGNGRVAFGRRTADAQPKGEQPDRQPKALASDKPKHPRTRRAGMPRFRLPRLRLRMPRMPLSHLRMPSFGWRFPARQAARSGLPGGGAALQAAGPPPAPLRLEPVVRSPLPRPDPQRRPAASRQAEISAPEFVPDNLPMDDGQTDDARLEPSRRGRPAAPSRRRTREDEYLPPSLDLLANAALNAGPSETMDVETTAQALESVLGDYRIGGEIRNARPGPAVTLFELDPPPGLKASRLESLADDIARSMGVVSARIATVPGSKMIGIEIPNPSREAVLLRGVLDSAQYQRGKAFLPLALGRNILGDPVVADLEKMPHLLVAGTTGSGKSVAINAMILSLLFRLSPRDCRMILIDPKMLEFSMYDDIPHLLTPVVTEPKTAVLALKWVVREMEERYRMMSQVGVKNIASFNARHARAVRDGKPVTREVQKGFDPDTGQPVRETVTLAIEHLPRIVVIVDEMADLMMVAGKEIEACVQRLAQMARASGIHLVMATQRPSVDVITGTIKANFPTRISFRLSSKIDSRTILNEQGAEKLLGQGDMLYQEAGSRVTRIHGPFVSEEEIDDIVAHLHSLGPPTYVPDVTIADEDAMAEIPGMGGDSDGDGGSLLERAVEIVVQDRKASTSYLQRRLGIGYNRAAGIMDELEAKGVVGPADRVGKREILAGGG